MNVDFANTPAYMRWEHFENFDPAVIEQWRNGISGHPYAEQHEAFTRAIRDHLIRDVINTGVDELTGEPTIYLGWFVTDARANWFTQQLADMTPEQQDSAWAFASEWHGTLEELIHAAKELTQ